MGLHKNRFMITITDLNGSRNFVLSQVVKNFAMYMLMFFIMLIVLTVLYVNYLKDISKELTSVQETLQEENNALIEAKKQSQMELEAIEGKISELEEQFNIDGNVSEWDLTKRIQSVALTGAQERFIFTQIPNGDPTNGLGRFTSSYGSRMHPVLKYMQFHTGTDYAMPIGTPVYATADGVIQSTGKTAGYGNMVEIRHNYGFSTRYGHLTAKFPVKVGDFVKKGDLVAYSGNSGRSTGPHLHYEVRFVQKPLNPVNFINWDSTNYNEIFQKEGAIQWQSLINLLTTQTDKAQ